MAKPLKISSIICAINEEKTITEIITQAKKYSDEVIVIVGKKSQDNTFKLSQKLADKTFYDAGVGKGEAIRIGAQIARYPILVFLDSDGSHNIKDIPILVAPILADQADMVVASRGLGGSDELHGTFHKMVRLIGSSIITLIINIRFKKTITDSQNGFRAIKKNAFEKLSLKSNDFTIEQEMVMQCFKKHFSVIEVPSHEFQRRFGCSNINLVKMTPRYLWTLLINLI